MLPWVRHSVHVSVGAKQSSPPPPAVPGSLDQAGLAWQGFNWRAREAARGEAVWRSNRGPFLIQKGAKKRRRAERNGGEMRTKCQLYNRGYENMSLLCVEQHDIGGSAIMSTAKGVMWRPAFVLFFYLNLKITNKFLMTFFRKC